MACAERGQVRPQLCLRRGRESNSRHRRPADPASPSSIAANMDEDGFADHDAQPLLSGGRELRPRKRTPQVLPICAKHRGRHRRAWTRRTSAIFLEDLGLERVRSGPAHPGQLHPAGPDLLPDLPARTKCRAWTITARHQGAPRPPAKFTPISSGASSAPRSSAFDDLDSLRQSMAAAKEKGLVRSEGKEYVMQDGDVVLFRFNV